MSNHIRLGQRVYGVTSDGTIVPTLVSKVELKEVKADLSDTNYHFDLGLNGPQHGEILQVKYRVLNHKLSKTWLTFDTAHKHALAILERLVNSDSVTVGKQRKYADRFTTLTANKEAERKAVDGVTVFSETENMSVMTLDLHREKRVRQFTQDDFPKHYIEPGEPVWVADTKRWRLIQGFVTEVHFTTAWSRNFNYYCGSHSNLDARTVFRTKRGAMNYLERIFSQTLPGILDRKRVPLVQQLSKAEKGKQRIARMEEVAKNFSL